MLYSLTSRHRTSARRQVLKVLLDARKPLAANEIAKATGMITIAVYPILRTLCRHELVLASRGKACTTAAAASPVFYYRVNPDRRPNVARVIRFPVPPLPLPKRTAR